MQKTCLIITITVSLLFLLNGLQAQTMQPKLNQSELMKQWIGTWKADIGKDTTFTMMCKSFYNGYEFYLKIETKGKITFEQKTLMGYDTKTDKLIESAINNSSQDIILMVTWYTSTNKCEEILFADISNPDKAKYKWMYEFKNPDLLIWTDIVNNKATNTNTFHRVK